MCVCVCVSLSYVVESATWRQLCGLSLISENLWPHQIKLPPTFLLDAVCSRWQLTSDTLVEKGHDRILSIVFDIVVSPGSNSHSDTHTHLVPQGLLAGVPESIQLPRHLPDSSSLSWGMSCQFNLSCSCCFSPPLHFIPHCLFATFCSFWEELGVNRNQRTEASINHQVQHTLSIRNPHLFKNKMLKESDVSGGVIMYHFSCPGIVFFFFYKDEIPLLVSQATFKWNE